MKRLIVIGTFIVATLQASPAFAEVTWVLWGDYVLELDIRPQPRGGHYRHLYY